MDPNAFNPSPSVKFVVRNASSMNRSIKVFNTSIGPGNTLDIMKVPGITEEDIRAEVLRGNLRPLLSSGALIIVLSTINFTTSDSNHNTYLNSIGLSGTASSLVGVSAGGGAELLIATPGSSGVAPLGDLSLNDQISVLINTTGGSAFWHLPDGTDGLIKEIASGAPGNLSTNFIGVTSTNNWSNDLLDLNPNQSARLVWITSAGGWIVVSTCANTNAFWD